MFYEVGLTEDKDRAREERAARGWSEDARRRERDDGSAAKREHPPERSTRTRLGRSRGRPRRLR